MHRTKAQPKRTLKLVSYGFAGAAGGAIAGAALGFAGGALPTSVRAALAALLGLLAIGVAVAELSGHRVPRLEFDRETPYGWLRPGPVSWALRNGFALGIGAKSRLGFWLWYAIPLGSLLIGLPAVGALAYGSYGLVRTLSAGGILMLEGREVDPAGKIFAMSYRARRLTNLVLLTVGVCLVVFVGL